MLWTLGLITFLSDYLTLLALRHSARRPVSVAHSPLVQMILLSCEGLSPAPGSPAAPHTLRRPAWTLKQTRRKAETTGCAKMTSKVWGKDSSQDNWMTSSIPGWCSDESYGGFRNGIGKPFILKCILKEQVRRTNLWLQACSWNYWGNTKGLVKYSTSNVTLPSKSYCESKSQERCIFSNNLTVKVGAKWLHFWLFKFYLNACKCVACLLPLRSEGIRSPGTGVTGDCESP